MNASKTAALVCVLIAVAAPLFASTMPLSGLYSLGSQGVICYPSTGGIGSVVASFGQSHPGYYTAAFDRNGDLYSIGGDYESIRYTLARIDPVTGAWNRVGSTGIAPTWGLAINPSGSAFAVQPVAPFTLYSVNLQTATSTVLATNVQLNGVGVLGMTFTPSGRLWGVVDRTYPPTSPTLVEINPITGALSPVLNVTGVPGDLVGIAFNENGELFGSASNSSYATVQLVKIDLVSGAAQVVGQPQPQADARALAFLPEPTTLSLLALGGLSLLRRRR